MDDEAQKLIEDRLKELPADVRDAVLANDLGERVRAIGERNHLHIDQTGSLEEETVLVMLGFADPREFVDQLQESLHVDETTALALAEEVNDEIFRPIRESMKLFAQSRAEVTEQTPEAPTPSIPVAPAKVGLPSVERMLTEATVAVPPPAPSQAAPPSYKVDPYHEPVE